MVRFSATYQVVLILGNLSRTPIHNVTNATIVNATNITMTEHQKIKIDFGSFLRTFPNKSYNILKKNF